jgi:hypothetical protein
VAIDFVPTTIPDDLYNIILEITPYGQSHKTTKRGFFVDVINACEYIQYWQYCSNTMNVALHKSVDGSAQSLDWIEYDFMCDDYWSPYWIMLLSGVWRA